MRSRGPSTVPYIMVPLERSPIWCAVRMTPSHCSLEHLALAIFRRTRSTRISAPPPGPSRARRVEALEHLTHRERLELGDVEDLLRRQGVQAEAVLALDPAEEVLVPTDAQLGVEAALEEDLHTARVDHFLQLLPSTSRVST